MKIFALIVIVALATLTAADCGCLKCSKNLQVVSPPAAPIKVIYRGTSSCTCNKAIPYVVQAPKPAPATCAKYLPPMGYAVRAPRDPATVEYLPSTAYDAKVQVPAAPACTKPYLKLVGLMARPDRIVLPANPTGCVQQPAASGPGPIFETLSPSNFDMVDGYSYSTSGSSGCGCTSCSSMRRYKRNTVDDQQPVDVLDPIIEENIRAVFFQSEAELARYRRWTALRRLLASSPLRLIKRDIPSGSKNRKKLANMFNDDDIDNSVKLDRNRADDSSNKSPPKLTKLNDLFAESLDWEQIFPQVSLLYLINTPIGVFGQFERLKRHLQPVVDCVPRVLKTSQDYWHDIGGKFKQQAVEFVANFLRTFNGQQRLNKREVANHVIQYQINNEGNLDIKMRRNSNKSTSKQHLALVLHNFGGSNAANNNTKAYLMLIDDNNTHRTKRASIIDDLIDKLRDDFTSSRNFNTESSESILERHFNAVPKLSDHLASMVAKSQQNRELLKHVENPRHVDDSLEPDHVIQAELASILARMQNLVQNNLESDLKIAVDLLKLQTLKDSLVTDWKKFHDDGKCHLVMTKRNMVTFIKEIDKFRGQLFKSIASHLLDGNDVNKTTLIKQLVRLFKLEMIFASILEEFSENVKLGGTVHHGNEELYWSQLEALKFVPDGIEKHEIEKHLAKLKESKLKRYMYIVEKLRNASGDDMNELALLVKQRQNLAGLQFKALKEMNVKVRLGRQYRKELKAILQLERELHENATHFGAPDDANEDDLVQKPKEDAVSAWRSKIDEFVKGLEAKKSELSDKIKQLIK